MCVNPFKMKSIRSSGTPKTDTVFYKDLSIEEIASLVSYADKSNFHWNFKSFFSTTLRLSERPER